jgi:squalene-hopene/tetraprenyl-beta-curcumene cyclase
VKKLVVLMIVATAGGAPGHAWPQEGDSAKKLAELYAAAADWLVGQQDSSGAWKMGPPEQSMPSPSYTGLIVASLAGAPEKFRARYKESIGKGTAFLLNKANPDGAFGAGPTGSCLKTYTTAIALMALSSVERSERITNAIRGGWAYLKRNQLKEGPDRGGLGYKDIEPKLKDGKLEPHETIANLSVTGFAAEGLQKSGLPQDDEFWKLVIEFARKCQNSSEVNKDAVFLAKLKEQGLSVGDDGGLFYAPSADRKIHKAGTKIADRETIQSYGSMTYEGIKTYLYSGLPKDSPEVKAAIDWVKKNYTVEVHPGFAFDAAKRHHLRGLYYYYLVMARALDAYGENPLETFDGVKHDWAAEIAGQLVKTVRESKMWVNDNPSWYEGDPVMVTSYVLMTADILFKRLK